MEFSARNAWHFSSICTFCNHFVAALKVDPLSEYMISGLSLRTMNRLRFAKKSDVCKDDNKSRSTALVKLQAYSTRYALPSFFGLCWSRIGPAKSTPTTWKGIVPCVLVIAKLPGGGAWYALVWNFLQPLQLPLSFFTRRRSLGTQKFSRTFAIFSPTPPCIVQRSAWKTSLAIKG